MGRSQKCIIEWKEWAIELYVFYEHLCEKTYKINTIYFRVAKQPKDT